LRPWTRHYQDRVHHAEQWLVRIHADIEQKFFEKAPLAAKQAP
jgi:hypothetical protein